MQASFDISPIGILHSPFKEKFGIPRQAGLIASAQAHVEFLPPYHDPNAFIGLDDFSHIWLTFGFHQNNIDNWRPLVRPPRLGGNKKVGVFASRSPFRPNGLGLSVVKLRKVETLANKTRLIIDCPDILDGSPIFDIKPYIHYSDAINNAKCGFAQATPRASLSVKFSDQSLLNLTSYSLEFGEQLKELIIEAISFDPRPAYHQAQESGREYGLALYDLNIRWRVVTRCAEVLTIEKSISA